MEGSVNIFYVGGAHFYGISLSWTGHSGWAQQLLMMDEKVTEKVQGMMGRMEKEQRTRFFHKCVQALKISLKPHFIPGIRIVAIDI